MAAVSRSRAAFAIMTMRRHDDRKSGGSDDERLSVMMKMRRASATKNRECGSAAAGPLDPGFSLREPRDDRLESPQLSIFSAAMKASCGISTLPNWRMRFLPSFCFSRSLRLRVMSPP